MDEERGDGRKYRGRVRTKDRKWDVETGRWTGNKEGSKESVKKEGKEGWKDRWLDEEGGEGRK